MAQAVSGRPNLPDTGGIGRPLLKLSLTDVGLHIRKKKKSNEKEIEKIASAFRSDGHGTKESEVAKRGRSFDRHGIAARDHHLEYVFASLAVSKISWMRKDK